MAMKAVNNPFTCLQNSTLPPNATVGIGGILVGTSPQNFFPQHLTLVCIVLLLRPQGCLALHDVRALNFVPLLQQALSYRLEERTCTRCAN